MRRRMTVSDPEDFVSLGGKGKSQSVPRCRSMSEASILQLPVEQRTRRLATLKSEKAWPAASEELPAELPARYNVHQMIGHGSYGCVWEAYDDVSKQAVAIKRVRNLFRNQVDCKRVLREIAILSRLEHEGIVKVLDIPAMGDVASFNEIFIIMEICDTDMDKLVRTGVILAALHVDTLFYNLVLGLRYLHSAGIYHRDLKPANCLVNRDCSVKICDFGLARTVGNGSVAEVRLLQDSEVVPPLGVGTSTDADGRSDDEEERDTATVLTYRRPRALSVHVATRWYRAPELILMQSDYTEAVDMWSAGCIYAELLNMLEGGNTHDPHPLFPGTSCYPLSPDHAHATDYKYHTSESNDQLNMIFDLLGTPSHEDLASLATAEAKSYVACFVRRDGESIRQRLHHVGEGSSSILENLLRFNPQTRFGTEQLLESDVFEEIRERSLERVSSGRVELDFETGCNMDEFQLRHCFRKEMSRYASKTLGAAGGA